MELAGIKIAATIGVKRSVIANPNPITLYKKAIKKLA